MRHGREGRGCAALQERIQLSKEQLAALIETRRTLLAHIGALLAEREQIGTRIRVIIFLNLVLRLAEAQT